MGGHFTQGKFVSKEVCKVYLEILEVEDSFWGSIRQRRKARLKTDSSVFVFCFLKCVYFEKESVHEQGRGRQRGRQKISSRLCTVSAVPDVGLQPMNPETMT